MPRANAEWTSNPLAYELEVLTLVNNEGVGFDIRNLMLEFNLYESITSNFLVGEIAIADAVGLLENAKIFGQETLRIRFAQPTGRRPAGPNQDIIDQVFRIYKVSGVHRIGQNTTVYKLSFCAPELIQAKRIRISQALRGSLTEIATKIAIDTLGIKVLEGGETFDLKLKPFFEDIEHSKPANYHVVIPNWTVNYTINWLLQHAQGKTLNDGFAKSFFFYQTANAGYRIQSLADMKENVEYLNGPPTGAFYYAPAAAAGTEETAKSAKAIEDWNESTTGIGSGKRILDYTMGKTANVLEGIMEGLFAQQQITINNTGKYQTSSRFDFLEKFYSEKGTSSDEEKKTGYPLVRNMPEELYYGDAASDDEAEVTSISSYENNEIQGIRISDYPDAHTTLSSDSNFVNDEKDAYFSVNHDTHLGHEQLRTATRQLLKYYTMNCLISARTDISVGKYITLKIPATRGDGENKYEGKFHSGKYLITEIKWGLTPMECRTNIKVIKDSYLNQIETASGEYAPLVKLQKKG